MNNKNENVTIPSSPPLHPNINNETILPKNPPYTPEHLIIKDMDNNLNINEIPKSKVISTIGKSELLIRIIFIFS